MGRERRINRLSTLFVKKVAEPGLYADGQGLWLQVTARNGAVARSWVFRYTRAGRTRDMGLGSALTVSLAAAREKAAMCRQQLDEGTDPLEARRQAKAEAAAGAAALMTFEACAQAYVAAHEPSWRNPKHRAQWRNTLATYAFPKLGALPVEEIDTGLVMQVLEPIWQAKPETANRVRGRIESVLDWAKARGHRSGENPARWRGHLDNLLPRKSKIHRVRHQPAMPYRQVPAFMHRLRQCEGISARALEWTILTLARTAETIGAELEEVDFDARVWTIPAERIKAGREHRVPLSDRAIEILAEVPREHGNPHLFIGARPRRGLSDMAMLELLRGLAPGYTVHGFRSSFRDWAAEQTAYPRELAEVALAHALKDKTEAAYQRGDLLEKRRRLMRDWANYLGAAPVQLDLIPAAGAGVIPIRARR